MKKAFIAMVALLVGAASCNKTQPTQSITSQTGTNNMGHNLARSGNCGTDNSSNPMDSVGTMHNQCFMFIVNNQTNQSSASMWNAADTYHRTRFGTALTGSASDLDSVMMTFQTEGMSAMLPNGRVKDRVVALAITVKDAADKGWSYCDCTKAVIDWEKVQLENNSLSQEERACLLGFGSVLRNSLALWEDRHNIDGTVALKISTYGAIADGIAFVGYMLDNPNNQNVWTRAGSAVAYASAVSTKFEELLEELEKVDWSSIF